MLVRTGNPTIVADHGAFESRANFVRDVEVLLRSIPARYLSGLGAIRLVVTSGFNRQQRRARVKRRGRKSRISSAAGAYHREWRGQAASIELFLDNIFMGAPSWLLRIPFLRRLVLGSTLFHEVGHHIHRTIGREHTEPEDVADRWSARLGRRFLLRRYWYLYPAIRLVFFVRRTLGSQPARSA